MSATLRSVLRVGLPLLVLIALAAAGCAPNGGEASKAPPPKPPEVIVSLPVRKVVTDYEDTTGRLEAVKTVDVRARVTGYLEKVHFKEGAEVKENEVLFEIDARTYQAELARNEAAVLQAEAHLNRLKADYLRASTLRARNAIGREEFDKVSGDRDEAVAALEVARAARDVAKQNVNYTKVRALISGYISRHYIDAGNLVKADDTLLTTIVSQNPMYAYFDVDERTFLRMTRLSQAGKMPASATGLKVMIGLADEEGFPHQGTVDFVDNRLDTSTGTLHMRAVFPNPGRMLTPGLFVRIRVPIGSPAPVIMVPEEALATDQGRKFLYVLDSDDKATYRPVKVGKLFEGWRVITEGLKEGERVIVDGLQRVRPGVPVTPKMRDQ